jgi:hypothetical protein
VIPVLVDDGGVLPVVLGDGVVVPIAVDDGIGPSILICSVIEDRRGLPVEVE